MAEDGERPKDSVPFKLSGSHERNVPSGEPRLRFSPFKGRTGLLITIAVVVILLIGFPAYRLFYAISLAIALVVAAILYFWHKLRPIRPEDVEDKRPLKLQ